MTDQDLDLDDDQIESHVVIPSSPADRKQIRKMLEEVVVTMTKIDFERETKKDLIDGISKQFDLPKKLLNKLARTMHKRNYQEVIAEASDFESVYDIITRA